MARMEPEMFREEELVRVFVAATLREAKRAEALLTERGVHYIVQPEAFGRTLFGSPRVGAVIYVPAGQAAYCGAQLEAAGLGLGVLIDESQEV